MGSYLQVDPIVVRQWALTFIQNGGIINNHSYKKREPVGVITDPVARGDMKRWMMLASREKPGESGCQQAKTGRLIEKIM